MEEQQNNELLNELKNLNVNMEEIAYQLCRMNDLNEVKGKTRPIRMNDIVYRDLHPDSISRRVEPPLFFRRRWK